MSSRGAKTKNGHVTTDEYMSTGYVSDPNAKILIGQKGKHGLPDFSHTPNRIYIKLNKEGTFRELRQYDENGFPVLEIGYHHEKKYDKNLANPVLHYHFLNHSIGKKQLYSK